MESGYSADDTAHHKLNLVFEVANIDMEPVNQEDHLEYHWIPLEQFAEAGIRPGAIKAAFVTLDEGSGRVGRYIGRP